MKVTVSWDMMSCNLVDVYWHFRSFRLCTSEARRQ